jgi:glycosyltransferase involved in cell wall biosynthesis
MKILHVNNSPEGGGTETYIHRIIQCLDKKHHDNLLFVQQFSQGNHPGRALKNTWRNIKRLRKTIDNFNPDVIHVHNINNFEILHFLNRQKPCLKSVHEFRPFCTTLRIRPDTGRPCSDHLSRRCFKTRCFSWAPGDMYRFTVDRYASRIIGRYPAVLVMSRFMADMIQPLLVDPSVLNVIPYFFDPPEKTPQPLTEKPRLFTAGRLVSGKGFDVLMDILTKVETPFEMRIAGDGPLRTALEKKAEQLNLNITFLGYLPEDKLAEHYSWSRLVVFPSTYPEPFGIVGLEAMGAARPVVAFDVGGVPDWLESGQTGYSIPPFDTDMFAKRIDELLNDDLLTKQMGDAGRARLVNEFSSERHVTELMDIYRRLLAENQ